MGTSLLLCLLGFSSGEGTNVPSTTCPKKEEDGAGTLSADDAVDDWSGRGSDSGESPTSRWLLCVCLDPV